MSDLPFVCAICPTYKRPECLSALLACWINQDYPVDRRALLILDDAGQFDRQGGDCWELGSTRIRFPTLQAKFNVLAAGAMKFSDTLIVLEDDDLYLPNHVSAHVAALASGATWSKPSCVLTKVNDQPLQVEPCGGNMHGSWAFTRARFEAIGGYDESFDVSKNQGFDLDLGRRLSGRDDWWIPHDGSPADPCEHGPISYIYHWGPAAYHGSGFGADFYRKVGEQVHDDRFIGKLVPHMDERTKQLYDEAQSWPASQSAAK